MFDRGGQRGLAVLRCVNAALAVGIVVLLATSPGARTGSPARVAAGGARPPPPQGRPSEAPASVQGAAVPDGPIVSVQGTLVDMRGSIAVIQDGATVYLVDTGRAAPPASPGQQIVMKGLLDGPDPWTQAIRLRSPEARAAP